MKFWTTQTQIQADLASRDKSRGQSMIEFALILPVILLVLVGVADLGRVYHETVTLYNAAREGARQAVRNYLSAADVINATIRESTDSGIEITSADVRLTCGANGAINTTPLDPLCAHYTPLRVTACHDFRLILRFFFPGTIRICRYAEMMVP